MGTAPTRTVSTAPTDTSTPERQPPPPDDSATPGDALAAELSERPGTDLGNAERFVRRYGRDVRYWVERGEFLIWNGRCWQLDETGQAERWAKNTVRQILPESYYLQDSKAREARAKWAIQSEKASSIEALLRLVKTEAAIPVQAAQLDADLMLFNVLNGTIDLRTGQIREARREDLITRCAPVAYDKSATCPLLESFLCRAMDGNDRMVAYLRRVTGCLLTGQPADRVFWFLYGGGGNGKSTLTDIFHALLGDYARKTAADTLLAKQGGDGIPNDLADLKGARLVTSAELSEARRLNEARIKDLTGRDIIKARFLRQEFFEFQATFKLFMYGNHRPIIRGTDEGIWDRVKLVPFTVTIPEAERDEHLPQKLRGELPGILNWALAGCLEWQRDGLQHPEEVKAATLEYRQEQDPLEDFLAECCVQGDQLTVTNPTLWAAYECWCKQNGEAHPLGRKTFTEKMEQRGFQRGNSGGRFWKGLGVVSNAHLDSAGNAPPESEAAQQDPFGQLFSHGEGGFQAQPERLNTSFHEKGVDFPMSSFAGITGNSCSEVFTCSEDRQALRKLAEERGWQEHRRRGGLPIGPVKTTG
jgi:putative DNA primase/helicase